MKYLILMLFSLALVTQSCESSDDLNELEQANLNATCFQDEGRDVIAVFTEVEGFVVNPEINDCSGVDNNLYLLTGGPEVEGRNLNQLLPCDLSESFRTDNDSLAVVYSGFLFETFEEENVCAQNFEITSIQLTQNQ